MSESEAVAICSTPSTMNIGDCERFVASIDCGPRSTIDGTEPGRPEADTMFAPVTLPWSSASGLEFGTGMSAELTWATTNGSFFCSVPAVTPVMTTWFSFVDVRGQRKVLRRRARGDRDRPCLRHIAGRTNAHHNRLSTDASAGDVDCELACSIRPNRKCSSLRSAARH